MRISEEDRERRSEARRTAKATGGNFNRWRGHGENRGYRYWSVTYNSTSKKGSEVGSATSTATVDRAKNYDQKSGVTLTGDKAVPIPSLSTAMHWLGSIDIHDLLTILGH